MAEELGPQKPLLEFHQALSGVFEQAQKPALALYHLRQAIEIERRLYKEQQAQKTAALLAGFQVEKARQEAEIERLRNSELARANRELALAIENLREANEEKVAAAGQTTLTVARIGAPGAARPPYPAL
jgi:hypothetical protein